MERHTRIHLLRHGPTHWNEIRRFQGRSDQPLSEKGVEMAEEVGRTLADLQWDAVFSSPLVRASHTARIVIGARPLEVQEVQGLVEMDLGSLEGRVFEDLADDEKSILDQWREQPSLVKMPGGEALEEVQARVVASMLPIIESHRGQSLLVVGHAFSLLTYICAAIDLDLDKLRSLFLDPLGLTTLEVHPDRVLLRGFNHVPGRQAP